MNTSIWSGSGQNRNFMSTSVARYCQKLSTVGMYVKIIEKFILVLDKMMFGLKVPCMTDKVREVIANIED